MKAQTAPKLRGKKGGRTAAPKKHSKKRIAAIVIAVLIALLCACGAAYYVFFVRPPTDTIHDKTNGDRVDTSSLLNQARASTMCSPLSSARSMRTRRARTP